jgi:hypothetical protein
MARSILGLQDGADKQLQTTFSVGMKDSAHASTPVEIVLKIHYQSIQHMKRKCF